MPAAAVVNRYSTWIKWVSIALIAVAVLMIMQQLSGQLVEPFNDWINSLGAWGEIVFGLIYVIATVALVPGLILTIAGGALFGLLWGTIVVSISSITGAALAFLIARYVARKKVERKAAENDKFEAVDNAVDEGGWKIVAMLRLSPAIPFNLQNYLYGLTSIRFWPYVLTSWIAMLPGTFMYVYIGHIFGVAASGERETTIGEWVLLALGLLATIAVTVYITILAKKQLQKETDVEDEQTEETPREQTTTEADSTTESRKAPWGTIATAIVAVLAISVAAYAYINSEAVESYVNRLLGTPPSVTAEETYEVKSDGQSFSHSTFDDILKKYVDAAGWVDYAGLKENPEKLNTYIRKLGDVSFDELGRNEKLALLINAYNAFTLKLIIDKYPIDSIKDIEKEKRWHDRRWTIGSHTWSLNQIEHEQIRPKFVEPRIHFALVCAAIGCPILRDEAYTADRIDQQLQDQTVYSHNHDRWFRFDQDENTVYLTKLYKWYGGDFEQVAGSILKFAARYSGPLAKQLESSDKPGRQWLEYDWTLNDQKNNK